MIGFSDDDMQVGRCLFSQNTSILEGMFSVYN
jgi:hypothetical protein